MPLENASGTMLVLRPKTDGLRSFKLHGLVKDTSRVMLAAFILHESAVMSLESFGKNCRSEYFVGIVLVVHVHAHALERPQSSLLWRERTASRCPITSSTGGSTVPRRRIF